MNEPWGRKGNGIMIARPILLAAVLTAAAAVGFTERAHAQSPPYLILGAPAARAGHGQQPPRVSNTGVAYPVVTQTYAYGWFGAQPRRHGSRHFGYYRNYTQWTHR